MLETLQSRGPLTLKELQGLWLRSSVNDEGKELATRTFHNHIQSIADIFGIEIACDRRDNTYYIDNGSEIGGSGVRNWMLEALSLNGLLNESAGLKDRILFEDVPSSPDHGYPGYPEQQCTECHLSQLRRTCSQEFSTGAVLPPRIQETMVSVRS